MTGYDRVWDCHVCGEPCRSVDYPRVRVCERCVRPLANKICQETLKSDLVPGIDADYFMRRAYEYAELLLGRGGKKCQHSDSATSPPVSRSRETSG